MMLTLSVELYSEAGVMTDMRELVTLSSDCPGGREVMRTGTFQFQML